MSVVIGEHHVVIGQPPIVQGDAVHLLGGPHVGGAGTQVVGHQVTFATTGEGLFAHTIRKPEYWAAPVVPYIPLQLDLALSQSFARHYSQLGNTDGTVQGNTEAALRLALYASALGVALGVGELGKQAEAAAQLVGLQFDRDVFADTLALPGGGINRALEMITGAADALGQNVAQVQGLVSSALIEVGRNLRGAVGAVDAFVEGTLVPWITNTAQGIANVFSEFIGDIPGVFDLGRSLGFIELDAFRKGYEQASREWTVDPVLGAALEAARITLQQAGQTVVVQQGFGANPFNAAGFNPDAVVPAAVSLREGQLKAITINLPFEAAIGGQKLMLTLSGPNAGGVVLRTDGTDLLPQGSAFALVVPEGRRQLVVGLKSTQDIAADASLTLSVTLADAEGQSTHSTQVEAHVTVANMDSFVAGAVPPINFGANGFAAEEILLPQTGAWIIERIEAKNYIFQGGQGSYRIYAGPGNDQLYGGPNFDRLSSRAGNDLLQGFGGNDELYGWEDNDVLEGGDGDDRLYGDLSLEQAGQDYLDGGAGDDLLVGGAGNDVLLGGSGNDDLRGDGGTTELTIIPPDHPFNTGFSFTLDYSLGLGEDTMDGGAGDDNLIGFGGADLLLGGDGIDVLFGDHNGGATLLPWDPAKDGEDYLDGGAGNDWLYGGGLADVLIGGSGDDVIFGEGALYAVRAGDDWLEGGEGNDQLYGGVGADVLFGGIGDDLLVGEYANEPGSNDMLHGGAGIDELQGGGGNDSLAGGSENDRLFGQDGGDILSGDEGDDELQGGLGDDELFGGRGDDFLLGQEGADLLDGEEDDDLVRGGEGNDTLFGGDGIDEVQGGDGDDLVIGGAGDDFLYGDGNDPTVLSLIGGNDTLNGEEGDDQLWGGGGQDRLFGGDGSDQLVGDVGDDVLFGEAGNDSLFGDSPLASQAGNDTLGGGEGDDVLQGGGGNDQLEGGSGDDVLFGESWDGPYSAAGEDDLHGGAGNDRLIGGGGLDTYRFSLGDGVDSIEDDAIQSNRLVFGSGVMAESLSLDVVAGDSLVVRVGHGGDAVQIIGFGLNSPAEFHTIGRFEFADGTVLTSSQLLSRGFHLSASVTGGTLFGTTVADHMQGSQVDDWFHGREGNDILLGGEGADVLEGDEGDDVVHGGEGHDRLYGGTGVNVLHGGAGNDLLESHGGGDQLFGGMGDDIYRFLSGLPTVSEDANAGIDTIQLAPISSLTLMTPDHVENVQILDDFYLDPTQTVDVVGNALDNQLSGPNQLDGREGNDILVGVGDNTFVFGRGYGQDIVRMGKQTYMQTGLDRVQFLMGVVPADITMENHVNHLVIKINGTNDQLSVESYFASANATVDQLIFTDGTIWNPDDINGRVKTFVGGEADDSLYGLLGDDAIWGMGGDDQIRANMGNDILDGGAGSDFLEGSSGHDTYIFGRGYGDDFIDEQGNFADVDTIRLTEGIIPGDVTLRAMPDNGSDIVLLLNGTDDQLGLAGFFLGEAARVDQIQFADGTIWDYSEMLARLEGVDLIGTDEADYLSGNVTNDILSGMGGNDSLRGRAGDDKLLGGAGSDQLDGGAGSDTLDGGIGADTMIGGSGNDLYVVDDVGDGVTEEAGLGVDTVQSSISYALGANVENLTLAGSAAINGTGNSLNNIIVGNTAANVLAGGTGNDTYVVGAGDTVVEAASAGTDIVQTDISWTLGTNLEKLVLTGTSAIDGSGNGVANTLTGNSAANILNGGAGGDTLIGGHGDDMYIVDNASDKITELPHEGIDTVQSLVTYTLAANVENLTLTGIGAINGTGNGLDNILTGNGAANRLTGGGGNDTYVVGAGDTVVEGLNAGRDTVKSSVTHTLAANIENLTLTGTAAINGTGNGLNNILTGNSAANTLTGGTGNDSYVVGAGDTVVEGLNAGTDTVESSATWVLGANLENLTLTGSAAINGTGNILANVLTGNHGNNALAGGDGNDTITGGLGNDALNGGTGNDVFQFARGDGRDVVTDASGTSDRMHFGSGINPLDLMLSRNANDLSIALHGSTDQVTLLDWYSGTTHQIETVQAGNGQQLINTQVNQLIQAMAGFTQQTGLTWEQGVAQRPQDVQQIIAASWQ